MQNDDRLIYVSDLKKIVSRMVEVPAEMRVRMLGAINRTKTADAVPVVHGRWVESTNTCYMMSQFTCSECGGRHIANTWKYCPNCGAKMDGGKDDGN